ncbi:MAG: prepilin-type N-terminal cleavage/methylation domain-containing protein [Pirellulaceae bacterium]
MNARRHRRGLSLLELLVVVTLMGVFASTAFMRFGRDIFGDSGARSVTRTVSLGLLQAQRAAIRTGDRHALIFQGPLANAISWTIIQETAGGSQVVISGPHTVADEVTMSCNQNEMWFDFEGAGSQMFAADISGPNRSYELRVEPLTRMIRTREVTP